jgi:hypothetical protein
MFSPISVFISHERKRRTKIKAKTTQRAEQFPDGRSKRRVLLATLYCIVYKFYATLLEIQLNPRGRGALHAIRSMALHWNRSIAYRAELHWRTDVADRAAAAAERC